MSARSSAHDLVALALATAVAGCSSKSTKPEADPERVTALAARMLANVPVPAAARNCDYPELVGGATLTRRTAVQLARQRVEDRPELAEYVNPPELDSPAARTLLDSQDATARRQAAAELLAAPFYLLYHVDLVDTPLVLGVKDFKKGYVGARALRYDRTGKLDCIFVFLWTSSKAKQQWAIEQSNKPLIDPAVQKAMQDDLKQQMLARVAALAVPPPPKDPLEPVDDRHDRQ